MSGEDKPPFLKAYVASLRATTKANKAFLQAVVRNRGTTSQGLRGWFPILSKHSPHDAMLMFAQDGIDRAVWQNPHVPPYILRGDDEHIYVEALRYRLRVIWHRAASGDTPEAAVRRLICEMREAFYRSSERYDDKEKPNDNSNWLMKTCRALEWLERNTHKLRICGIADCKNPYFIVTPSRKKYCSDYCKEFAEVERSRERSRRTEGTKDVAALGVQGGKKPRLSPKGHERISKAAKAKAQRLRTEKKRLKKG